MPMLMDDREFALASEYSRSSFCSDERRDVNFDDLLRLHEDLLALTDSECADLGQPTDD